MSATVKHLAGLNVLSRTIELYLTVCGLTFAASCLEKYKQRNQKKLRNKKTEKKQW